MFIVINQDYQEECNQVYLYPKGVNVKQQIFTKSLTALSITLNI